MTSGPSLRVLCVLAGEQRHAHRAELERLAALGVELVHEDSPDHALDSVGARDYPVVIVGMTVEMMDGLEFLALLMKRHKDFAGRVVVLPDKGDPFPPMLQVRDPHTGKSSTEAIDFARLEELVAELVEKARPKRVAAEPPPPARAQPADKPKREKPRLPARASALEPPKAGPVAPRMVVPVEAVPPPLAAVEVAPTPVVAAEVVQPPPTPSEVSAPRAAPIELAPLPPSVEPARADVPRAPRAEVERVSREGIMAVVSPAPATIEPALAASLRSEHPVATPRGRGAVIAGIVGVGVAALAAAVMIRACSNRGADRVNPSVAALSAKPPAQGVETVASVAAKNLPAPAPAPEDAHVDLSQPVGLPLSFAKRHADYTVADSSKLESILGALAHELEADPSARVEVGGHTSKEGAESFNFELGQRRADGVKAYLVTHGISAARIVVKNYGASLPAQGTDSDADRRVTLRLIDRRGGGDK